MPYFSIENVDAGINKRMPSNKVVWSDGRNVRFDSGEILRIPGKLAKIVNFSGDGRKLSAILGYYDTTNSVYRILLTCGLLVYWTTMNADGSFTAPRFLYSLVNVSNPAYLLMMGNTPIIYAKQSGAFTILGTSVAVIPGIPSFGTGTIHNHRMLIGDISSWPSRLAWCPPVDYTRWCYDTNGDLDLMKTGMAGYLDLIAPQTAFASSETIKKVTTIDGRPFAFTDTLLWGLTDRDAPVIYSADIVEHDIELMSAQAITETTRTGKVAYFFDKKGFFVYGSGGLQELPIDIRDYALAIINPKAIDTPAFFTFYKDSTREVWFCAPTGDSLVPDTAFVYHVELKNWTICDCNFLCYGEADEKRIPFDVCGDSRGNLYQMDEGFDDNVGAVPSLAGGVPINAWIESGDICLSDASGPLDHINKYIHEITPMLGDLQYDNVIFIQVGTKERLLDEPLWSAPYEFKVGTSVTANFRKRGKWFRIRISTYQKNSPWSLRGCKIKYSLGGLR